MAVKELIEIDMQCQDVECVKVNHPNEIIHRLQFVKEHRGYIQFRDRETGKFYFQGSGGVPGHPVWFAEKEG